MAVRIMDMLKFTFKVLAFKLEQRRLTTSIYSVIQTGLGSVRGVKRKTIWGDYYFSFERIPFAKPPLGELRFKAPVPVEPWNNELDCTAAGNKPLQTYPLFSKYIGNEDCLYLNVYAKDLKPDKLRPVMVWIYGGGFQVGEATRDMYAPDFLMTKDVVVVTVSYRLGPLGFLSLDDPEADVPGNAGLKDQIMGLRWVKQNIEAFGGDPNNVTLFGESAGGASTHLLTVSHQSKGLIHKAIAMSGTALCPWVKAPRNNWGYRLAQKLGYTGDNKDKEILKFLCKASGGEIVKASTQILSNDEKHHRILFAFGPVVEPYETEHTIMAKPAEELMKETWSNSIPIMFGGTSFEGLLFYPEVTRRPATLDEVKDCENLLPIDIDPNLSDEVRKDYALQLKSAYFGDKPCSPATMLNFLELESYREFWHPIYRTVQSRLENSSCPTYLYRFDYDSKLCNAIRTILCGHAMRGVCHGDDMYYIFHSMLSHKAAIDSPEHKVIKDMVDMWTSFAAKSDPNCDSIKHAQFPPLKIGDDIKCFNISTEREYKTLPEQEKFRLWSSFYDDSRQTEVCE